MNFFCSCLLLTASFFLLSLNSAWGSKQITFWTTEEQTERLEVQKKLSKAFRKKTGIQVMIKPVQEDQLSEKINSHFKTGGLPDVICHPVILTSAWAKTGVLDVESATEVFKILGNRTFYKVALDNVRFQDGYATLPIDGWRQLLLYRKDLFRKNNLPVPDSWGRILKAARRLHNPPIMRGLVVPTIPDKVYTQQVFEHFALSNGIQLTDASGKINLRTPEMIELLEFYKELAQFAPQGNINWLQTRQEYLSGRAAMILWSPFILDELSGLRKDLLVGPDFLKGKPGHLAKNTGFVSVIQGPNGASQYNVMNCIGILKGADKASAKQWAVYLLSHGYLSWLSMAPEGKHPMRRGSLDTPDCYRKAWMELEFDSEKHAKISDFYGYRAVTAIVDMIDDGFHRWGFIENRASLAARIYEERVIPRILKQYIDGNLDVHEAAAMIDRQVKALKAIPGNK